MTDSILRSYQYSSSMNIVPFVLRLNLNEKTQAFDDTSQWAVANTTITANALTAPDGTATAEKATVITAPNALFVPAAKRLHIAPSGSTVTTSIFLKAVTTCQWMKIMHGDGAGNFARAWFDILNGIVGTLDTTGVGWTAVSSSMQPAGNGFYRCIVTYTMAGQLLDQTPGIAVNANGSSVDAASGTEYGVWGIQTQLGTAATEYVPVL